MNRTREVRTYTTRAGFAFQRNGNPALVGRARAIVANCRCWWRRMSRPGALMCLMLIW